MSESENVIEFPGQSSVVRSKAMTRQQLARWLTDQGIPTSDKALEGLAQRGTGPQYFVLGRKAFYRLEDVTAWLDKRMRPRAFARRSRDAHAQ